MHQQEYTMPGLKEITAIPVEKEFHTCPDCGYERGFHTSVVNAMPNRDVPVRSTREVFCVILICPECGARFDVGWRIPSGEFDNRFVKATVMTPTCIPHGSPASCLRVSPRNDEHPPE
jgi:transcription elongation factor Elf1